MTAHIVARSRLGGRALVLAATALLATFAVRAEQAGTAAAAPQNAATIQRLLTQPLAGIQGKEVLMFTVEYLPGGSSPPHRHDADVFVYVLEGALLTQVDGKPEVILKPGEIFHETPNDVHRQSANASQTEPVKFLVIMVKDQDRPPTRPAP